MSTMPGEHVDHMYAGQMGPETLHFLESVLLDREPLVSAEHARMVMESYLAADISAEIGEPVSLPLSNSSLAKLADMKAAQ
jgi:myo-inositol 2-dehydrogenase/D-chiro-inositol 1-dehydrogenase